MAKNILIISSNFTGNGHKSITESFCEKIKEKKEINVHVVDGFSLGGSTLLKIGKSYGPITRTSKNLWELIWELSIIKASLVNEAVELLIEQNFKELLIELKPDMILSVHPNFNGSIINILQKHHIEIPFITFVADLVSIYPLWVDKRADFIISPTQEAKEKCIEYGISENRIKTLGFPVRSKFYKSSRHIRKYDMYKPLKCLIMSGGEGVGNMRKIGEILLENFNSTVKIVVGRNKKLKSRLEQTLLRKYGERVKLYGFMENIQDLMVSSDVAFTRGSPNVIMEAIACNVPLVITGALPGQEEGNPAFVQKYNLGVVCTETKNMNYVISDLLANNGERLIEIKKSQSCYFDPDVSKNIIDFILGNRMSIKEQSVAN